MFNNLNILFFSILMTSTLISISSLNWFNMWMGLEINMISFIPIMLNHKNLLSNESAMKYFLIQSIASSTFIMLCMFSSLYSYLVIEQTIYISKNFLILPLILKLGASPFQMWFIMIMEGLNWFKCFILMTWQKVAPLFMLFYIFKSPLIMMIMSSLSLITGAVGGLNQTSLKKIMAYSSVNHLGWLLSSLYINKSMFVMYFSIYFIMNLFIMINFNNYMSNFNQIYMLKQPLSFSIMFLSLAGMPPTLGFLPKWMIIQYFIMNQFFMLIMIMLLTTLITLIFYLKLMYTNLMMSSSQKWTLNLISSKKKMNSLFTSISLFSLLIFNIMF